MEPPRPAAAGPHDNKPSIDGRPPGTAPVPPLDPKPFPPMRGAVPPIPFIDRTVDRPSPSWRDVSAPS
jgi:hypothetical protein